MERITKAWKAWGDYSDDDVDDVTDVPETIQEPQQQVLARGRKTDASRRHNSVKRPPAEGRAEAYRRRRMRVCELVQAQPGKNKEFYHAILEAEEKKAGHAHIPTIQYTHSILFALMNDGDKVTSSFENNGVVWVKLTK